MNWIDFLVSGLVLLPAISGFRNGLIAGLLRGIGIVAGIGLAIWKMPLLMDVGVTTLGCQKSTVPLFVLALGVVAGWVVGMLAGWAWKKTTEGTEIGFADRAAGFAVGVVKGSLLALAILAALTIAMPKMRGQLQASWTGRHALEPAVKSTRAWMEGRIEAWRK